MSAATQKLEYAMDDLNDLKETIENKMSRLDNLSAGERLSIENEIETHLRKFEELIDGMTRDLNNVRVADSKAYFQTEIQTRRKEYAQIVTELKQKRQSVTNNAQRDQLMQNANRTNSVIQNLDTTIELGQSSLQTGQKINETLQQDSLAIENIDKNLDKVENLTIEGNRKISSMIRRAFINGCITWTIDVLLFIGLIVSIILKFK